MDGSFSESASQGPSRRPRWGHRRGKKSALLGYPKRLWLQWEAKWAKMAFLVIFACHVKYALNESNAMIAPQEKHETRWGNAYFCEVCNAGVSHMKLWRCTWRTFGAICGFNFSSVRECLFKRNACVIGTFGMWDFAWLIPHPSWSWLRFDAMCKDLDQGLHALN